MMESKPVYVRKFVEQEYMYSYGVQLGEHMLLMIESIVRALDAYETAIEIAAEVLESKQ